MNKRTILIGICCLFSILLQAQTEHFKFMGIPLDGKISAFDRELKKKGFELDNYSGKMLEGTYIYNGVFSGETAQVFVNFDSGTKNVYQATVIIKNYTRNSAIRKYEDFRDMLEKKYSQDEAVKFYRDFDAEHGEEMKKKGIKPFEWKHTAERDGYESTIFIIPHLVDKDFKGTIEVFVSETFSNITYSTDYNLFIKYSDWMNENLHRDNTMDDL